MFVIPFLSISTTIKIIKMKLKNIRKPIMEIFKSPTRVLKRINNATNYSNTSMRYSDVNSIDPRKYFEKNKSISNSS